MIFKNFFNNEKVKVIIWGGASGVMASIITSVILYGIFNLQILQKQPPQSQTDNSATENKQTTIVGKIFPDDSYENMVINAVKKANPAVFSIVITKDVPVIEQYFRNFNPWNDFWGDDFFGPFGFDFQIPEYRQKGTEKKEVGGGTGFFISKDGLAITNKHVVSDDKASYTALTNDGQKYDVEIVAKDPVLDLAIVRVKGNNFPFLSFEESHNLKVGQTAIAIGNALGEFRNTVSVGVISGLSRSLVASGPGGVSEQLDEVIQTDAAINPGNSGGPLLNLQGKVIGVNAAVAMGSQNVGFAIPALFAKDIADSVKNFGKIVRPYIGIRYINITPALKEKNKLSVDYGILVVRGKDPSELAVIPGSPANKAGIVENDIILEIDGKKLDGKVNFANIIRLKKPGDVVKLKILHRGEEKIVDVKLEEMK
jgi:serine protease Do